ncbi:hypothetical protein J7399_01585 [Shimia sp. R9_1]|uniref:hypothetical protein n=1 Tax=Shimia sp. R9_1 TaxID=2821111 RepID=UPI001ADABB25|nr:hypothetical protein [Shimia sp. R9_1]MBO9406103.1 hypothetical protein [Shimia sp. R9_1]
MELKVGAALAILLTCAGCGAKEGQPLQSEIDREIEGAHAVAVVCENIAADFRAGEASKNELCSGYDENGWPI